MIDDSSRLEVALSVHSSDTTVQALENDRSQGRINLLIDGQWTPATSDQVTTVIDPASENVLAQVADASVADVDAAVTAARVARTSWARVSPAQRTKLLWQLADLIERDGEHLSVLEVLNQGKPLELAQALDVQGSAETLRYYAGWSTKLHGVTSHISADDPRPIGSLGVAHHAFSTQEPVGVVAAIVPWNVPLVMAVAKLGPALTAGCTVVLKPAPETPLTTLRLGQLILEAGFPPGVVNIITGGGDVGVALVNHPGVDKIAFTGSTPTGRAIAATAGQQLKRVTLELGGKSPLIVFNDADLESAAQAAAWSIFLNAGQMCFATSRLLIQRDVYAEVLDRVCLLAGELTLGSGLDSSVGLGPVISARQQDRVMRYIESAIEAGADVRTGGARVAGRGFFVEPTVIASPGLKAKIMREEVFGPVLCAAAFDDDAEAVRLANDTEYGLAASLWTQNLSRAHTVASVIEAGTVWVNCNVVLDESMPFAGWKQSGLGSEGGRAGVEEYLQHRSVVIAL